MRLRLRHLLVTALVVMAGVAIANPAEAARKPPASCIRALDSAERVVAINSDYVKDVSEYFGTIGESASRNSSGGIAGVTRYLTEQADATNVLTGQTDEATARLTSEVAKYNAAARACRKGR